MNIAQDRLLVVFVAPPWGDALSDTHCLDLSATTPPVSEVVEVISTVFPAHRQLLAIQIYETLEPAPLAQLTARFDWSMLNIYEIDPPGHNSDVLLATTELSLSPTASSRESTLAQASATRLAASGPRGRPLRRCSRPGQ
jgi:hypothetical protein